MPRFFAALRMTSTIIKSLLISLFLRERFTLTLPSPKGEGTRWADLKVRPYILRYVATRF